VIKKRQEDHPDLPRDRIWEASYSGRLYQLVP
jgi:hypothetical protein